MSPLEWKREVRGHEDGRVTACYIATLDEHFILMVESECFDAGEPEPGTYKAWVGECVAGRGWPISITSVPGTLEQAKREAIRLGIELVHQQMKFSRDIKRILVRAINEPG